MQIEQTKFGTMPNEEQVSSFVLRNRRGTQLSLMTYGATVTGFKLRDRNGDVADVVLGFDELEHYRSAQGYLGATVGRFANRIAQGHFELGGMSYKLATNDGENHLHGGRVGFDKRVFRAEPFEGDSTVGVVFHYTSPDGEEGYPGTLEVTATYSLSEDDTVTMRFTAVTTAPTPVNLTNHAYWNLAGAGSGSVLDHVLTLFCDHYLPVDEGAIPTGEKRLVAGTPMDFRSPKPIGADIGGVPPGYDHCYVVNREEGGLRPAAELHDPKTGRTMRISTTQPGVQLYTGNLLETTNGKGGGAYRKHDGMCLETQNFPNSVNQPDFPSSILRPGDRYDHTTVHEFSVR